MKLGLLTSILDGMPFEELVEYAASVGLECLEVACWPRQKAERRYSGVSHIDVTALDDKKAAQIDNLVKGHGIELSALSYYPNPLDSDALKREESSNHIIKVIRAAETLGVNTVGTFIGRDPKLTVEANMEAFKTVWAPIIEEAEKRKVRVAIENCPMLFTNDEWPGGKNIATSPKNWRAIFAAFKSDYLGLNFDPSHFIWQQMDYINPIYSFTDKLFHIHLKDVAIDRKRLDDVGIMATPLEYMRATIPGHGDVDWPRFVSALYDVQYGGCACLEIEDRAFEADLTQIKKSIELSYRYMRTLIA